MVRPVGRRVALRATLSAFALAGLVGGAMVIAPAPASAKKCVSEATGLPCKKCHNSATGGKEDGWTPYGQKYKAKGKSPC